MPSILHLDDCPICHGSDEHPRILYESVVCTKCRSRFAFRRVLAQSVDMCCMYMLESWFAYLTFRTFEQCGPQFSVYLDVAFYFLLTFPFVMVLCNDAVFGVSIGKYLFDLQVVSEQSGQAISIWRSIIRNLYWFVPLLPIYVLFQLWTGRHAGDYFAGTRVVRRSMKDHAAFAKHSSVSETLEFVEEEVAIEDGNPYRAPRT